MANRSARAAVAKETIEICERGDYVVGERGVKIRSALTASRDQTVLYSPDDFVDLFSRRDARLEERGRGQTSFEVRNETTLSAARRLSSSGKVLALNFASAKNPGGGFLGGSEAQEESLARASGLYACIAPVRRYYDYHRSRRSCLYSDHVIFSPGVPVFRDDEDRLLEEPYPVDFLTCPAVNAGAVRANEPDQIGKIISTMSGRMEKVLSVAVAHHAEQLVLGAWGCGVFRNVPSDVASGFEKHLRKGGRFEGAFQHVCFAVLDRGADGKTLTPFQNLFGGP